MAKKEDMMEEEFDDVLVLIDKENQEHSFQMIDMIEVDGSQYAVLAPMDEGSDEDEAIILKVVNEDGEDVLYDIESDEEWEKVVDLWNEAQED